MWVPKLGGKIESEIFVVRNQIVSNFDHFLSSLFEGLLKKKGF